MWATGITMKQTSLNVKTLVETREPGKWTTMAYKKTTTIFCQYVIPCIIKRIPVILNDKKESTF
jgi:hypothetical protein